MTINLSFSAITLAISSEHHFRFENHNGNEHIVFFHPEHEEHQHSHIGIHQHHDFKSFSNKLNHVHDFQLASSNNEISIVNTALKIDYERSPPLILISEAFNFIPSYHSVYKYYKYPSGLDTTSLSLKTIVLLI